MKIQCSFNTDSYNDDYGVSKTTATLDLRTGKITDVKLLPETRSEDDEQLYAQQVSFTFNETHYTFEANYDWNSHSGVVKNKKDLKALYESVILKDKLNTELPASSKKPKIKV